MSHNRALAFFFSFILTASLFAQDKWHVRQYSIEDGIPSSYINYICQDSLGFIWITSSEGLSRFDGKNFMSFQMAQVSKEPSLSKALSGLILGRSNELWIAGNGLIHYHQLTGKFDFFFHNDQDSNSLINDGTHGLYQDQKGNIWVGTWKGISKYDPGLKKFTNYALPMGLIMTICEDVNGNLWFGTLNGIVYKLEIATNKIKTYQNDPSNPGSLRFDRVKCIKRDNQNRLWFATWQGLNLYNEKTDDFTTYHPNENNLNDQTNQLNSLVIDSTCIWIAAENGVLSFDLRTKQFTKVGKDDKQKVNVIFSLYKDRNQGIWASTYGEGLRYFSLNDKIFTNIVFDENKSGAESMVSEVYEGEKDNLFLIRKNDIFYWDRKGSVLTPYKFKYSEILHQSIDRRFWVFYDNKIILTKPYQPDAAELYLSIGKNKELPQVPLSITQDASGVYWFVYKNSSVLTSFDTKTKTIRHYSLQKYFKRTDIVKIYADLHNHLYLMYWGALVKLSPTDGEWASKIFTMNKNGMRSATSSSIVAEENDNVWFGGSNGLEMYDSQTDKFTFYDKDKGLPANQTLKLVHDNQGKIWVSSMFGLSRFDPVTKRFQNYTKEDGLYDNSFSRAGIMTDKGEMVFGGGYGITLFNPSYFRDNNTIPPVVITKFKIFNKEIKPGTNSPLQNDISNTNEIELQYNQSQLYFEFAALNYLHAEKNKYAYKMEGLEQEWNYTDNRNTANYTILNPGEYTFRVIASNNDGVWNMQGASLKIVIQPPFWQTWLFRTLIVLLIIAIIIAIFISRTRQLEMKKRELTKLVEERTLELRESNTLLEERQKEILAQKEVLEVQASKLKILNSTKDKFFSIIGHDLINPISGINSLTAILKTNEIAKKSKEGGKIIDLIADSSRNAFSLLKNLLTWSQSQSEGLKADSSNLVLFKIVEESIQLLQVNAEKKQIMIINEIKPGTFIYADLNMITTVIRNLLSNAIKFTHNMGTVKIHSFENENSVQITIADTGIGMDEKTIGKLFRIDQQLTSKGTSGENGTGLGLIICKEFVEKNQGSINVESSPGKGTEFKVTLPKGNGPVTDLQGLTSTSIEDGNNSLNIEDQNNFLEKFEEEEVNLFLQSIKQEERIILIIEDIPEIRFNIKKSLEPYFIVEEAEDGKAGLQKANEILPDLIISDIVMPEMNGFELCTLLKSEISTSHIPVILLTSRSSDNSQLTGLSIGADDYIIKPFKNQFLLARVRNLIVQRNKLREKFSKEFIIGPSKVVVSNSEEAFLTTAVEIIEKHIDESEFSVIEFSKEIGMSQTQVNRKLEALTGKPTVNFIRSIRLKKAAQYLINSEMNVNEIATIVGFNNMSYFSKSFQNQFGMLPKQYSLKNKE